MRLLPAVFTMLVLASTSSATVNEISVGPYNISFELNAHENYTVIKEPVYAEANFSVYRLLIASNNSSKAEIGIVEYKDLVDSSPTLTKNYETLRMAAMRGYGRNLSSIDATIDGKDGFLITGLNELGNRMFYALYWLDSRDCECGPVSVGSISIGILSSYPLNTTRHLIDTLHVTRREPWRPALGNMF